MNKIAQRLAQLLARAMQIHEQSYDAEAADNASAKAQAEIKEYPSRTIVVDYNSFYRKTLRQSADEAAIEINESELGEIVYYLMLTSWNDIDQWVKLHA